MCCLESRLARLNCRGTYAAQLADTRSLQSESAEHGETHRLPRAPTQATVEPHLNRSASARLTELLALWRMPWSTLVATSVLWCVARSAGRREYPSLTHLRGVSQRWTFSNRSKAVMHSEHPPTRVARNCAARSHRTVRVRSVTCLCVITLAAGFAAASAASVEQDGKLHILAFDMPFSDFA